MDLDNVCASLMRLRSASLSELDVSDKAIVYESLFNSFILKLPVHDRLGALLAARKSLSQSEGLRKMLDDILSGRC